MIYNLLAYNIVSEYFKNDNVYTKKYEILYKHRVT